MGMDYSLSKRYVSSNFDKTYNNKKYPIQSYGEINNDWLECNIELAKRGILRPVILPDNLFEI